MDVQNVPLIEIEILMCVFFNSAVRALFFLPSFWDYVRHFTTERPSNTDEVI